jgi:hypothetical protein
MYTITWWFLDFWNKQLNKQFKNPIYFNKIKKKNIYVGKVVNCDVVLCNKAMKSV